MEAWDLPANWLIQPAAGDRGLGAGIPVLVGMKNKEMSCLDMGAQSLSFVSLCLRVHHSEVNQV